MAIDLIKKIEEGQKKAEVPAFKVGDTVRIVECAPISKTKRWTVLSDEAQAVQA